MKQSEQHPHSDNENSKTTHQSKSNYGTMEKNPGETSILLFPAKNIFEISDIISKIMEFSRLIEIDNLSKVNNFLRQQINQKLLDNRIKMLFPRFEEFVALLKSITPSPYLITPDEIIEEEFFPLLKQRINDVSLITTSSQLSNFLNVKIEELIYSLNEEKIAKLKTFVDKNKQFNLVYDLIDLRKLQKNFTAKLTAWLEDRQRNPRNIAGLFGIMVAIVIFVLGHFIYAGIRSLGHDTGDFSYLECLILRPIIDAIYQLDFKNFLEEIIFLGLWLYSVGVLGIPLGLFVGGMLMPPLEELFNTAIRQGVIAAPPSQPEESNLLKKLENYYTVDKYGAFWCSDRQSTQRRLRQIQVQSFYEDEESEPLRNSFYSPSMP